MSHMGFEEPVIMRLLFICFLALGTVLPAGAQAIARQGARPTYPKVYGYQSPRGSSAECDRARDVDPAGNYSGYPCWAQWAFGPKERGR
jgi:hypothetical protein